MSIEFIILDNKEHIQSFWASKIFYEENMLKYIASLKVNGLYIDIGSCIGNHTLFFSGVLGKEVISFEPNERNYNLQMKNIKYNNLNDKVKCFKMALSDTRYCAATTYPEGNWGMSCLKEGNDIVVETLDSFEFSNVGLIKIDVEGMELNVLLGAKQAILKSKPILFIETNHPESLLKYLPDDYVVGKQFNATPTFEFTIHREKQ